MKQKIKNYFLVTMLQLLSVVVSCQDKNKKTMKEEFDWKETVSCPSGYPVDVFMGGLELTTGGYTSLYSGVVDNAEWGSAGRSMSSGVKPLPKRLNVIWISFAEKTFYHVDAELDYEKIARLFRKGYYIPSYNNEFPEPEKDNYGTINVGFAPGGVAVVWVAGTGRQIEVGRYQGIKTEIPKEQVEKLKDEPEYSMLRPEYQESIMKNPGIIPQEVQEANKNKPIPYGLWDSYRKKYNWKINYELPKEAELDEMTYDFYNGEETNLFGDYQIKRYQIPKELHWNYEEEKAIPKQISFRWKEKVKENCGGYIKFNEDQIFKAFEELTQGKAKAVPLQITIRITHTGDDASVWLEGNGKSIGLYESEVKIF